jgi:hypothetical protein
MEGWILFFFVHIYIYKVTHIWIDSEGSEMIPFCNTTFAELFFCNFGY